MAAKILTTKGLDSKILQTKELRAALLPVWGKMGDALAP